MKCFTGIGITFGLAAGIAALPPDLSAQSGAAPAAGAAAPIVVVIQSTILPAPGGRAVLVRRQAGSPRDVIVLPPGAAAADLAAAMSLLAKARELDRGRLAAPQVRTSISRADFAAGQPAETVRYYENVLARLARSSPMEIPAVASGPALILPQNRYTTN